MLEVTVIAFSKRHQSTFIALDWKKKIILFKEANWRIKFLRKWFENYSFMKLIKVVEIANSIVK